MIYRGEEIINSASLTVTNYVVADSVESAVSTEYGTPLTLAKGQSYTYVIPAGSLHLTETPECTNPELQFSFDVPDEITVGENGSPAASFVECANNFSWHWSTEIEAAENAKAFLYRNNSNIATFPIDASWDWGLGTSTVDFGQTLYFEDSVNYSVVIPAGSICALNRPDIVNSEDVIYSFVGTHVESAHAPEPDWKTQWWLDDHISVVMWGFSTQISLAPNPTAQVWKKYCADGNTDSEWDITEVVPTLCHENGYWVVSADFGYIPFEAGYAYSVVLPGSTVVSADGHLDVNSEDKNEYTSSSGAPASPVSQHKITVADSHIEISGLAKASLIAVFTPEGKIVYLGQSENDTVNIETEPGIYILRVDNTITKVRIP